MSSPPVAPEAEAGVDQLFAELEAKVREYRPQGDLTPLEKAFQFASAHHHRQKRDSGEPYMNHPLLVAHSLADKGRLCRELRIDIYFDDQDECVVGVDEATTVFKIRNGGNFDYDGRKWLSTSKLTRL